MAYRANRQASFHGHGVTAQPIPTEFCQSRRTLFPLARARQGLFDDIPDRIEVLDPCRVQPEKFGALDPARTFVHFFLGDIFPERIIEAAGSLIGVEPDCLSLSG